MYEKLLKEIENISKEEVKMGGEERFFTQDELRDSGTPLEGKIRKASVKDVLEKGVGESIGELEEFVNEQEHSTAKRVKDKLTQAKKVLEEIEEIAMASTNQSIDISRVNQIVMMIEKLWMQIRECKAKRHIKESDEFIPIKVMKTSKDGWMIQGASYATQDRVFKSREEAAEYAKELEKGTLNLKAPRPYKIVNIESESVKVAEKKQVKEQVDYESEEALASWKVGNKLKIELEIDGVAAVMKGTIKSIDNGMAQVDFGNGDIFGIPLPLAQLGIGESYGGALTKKSDGKESVKKCVQESDLEDMKRWKTMSKEEVAKELKAGLLAHKGGGALDALTKMVANNPSMLASMASYYSKKSDGKESVKKYKVVADGYSKVFKTKEDAEEAREELKQLAAPGAIIDIVEV